MTTLRFYAVISASLGLLGLAFTPGYNPSFDFGLALVLLGLEERRSNDRET